MNSLIVEVHRKKEIKLFSQSKSLSGPYFAVPMKWFTAWSKYLKGSSKPARIYLHPLLDSKKSPRLNLVYKKDYTTVPKKVWDYLKQTYGSDHQIECTKDNIYSQCIQHISIVSSRTTSPSLSKNPSFRSIPIKKIIQSTSIETSNSKPEVSRTNSYRPRLGFEKKAFKSTESAANSLDSSRNNLNGIITLKNTGNLCFLNTTLQCILAVNNLTKIILKLKKNTPLVGLLKEFYLQAKTGVCDNRPFVEFFKKDFTPGVQHDMPEFLRKFMDALDKELCIQQSVQECDPWRDYESRHSKLIVNVFSGMACSKILCLECQERKENYEPFTLLTLQVTTSLGKSIEKYLEKEVIPSQYYCNNCEKVVDIEKQYHIVKYPNVLIIQLKRFVVVPFSRKINMHCEFGLELEINGPDRVKYDLRAVSVHTGNANSGHYSAYCKRNGKWYLFDDSNFQEVEISQLKEIQAYLLIYTRKIGRLVV